MCLLGIRKYSKIKTQFILNVFLLHLQVSVCDDYSLPVDFVKRIDFGSVKSLHHVPISLTATSPLAPEQVYYILLSVFLNFYKKYILFVDL